MYQVYNYPDNFLLNFPFSIFLHYEIIVEKLEETNESPRILKSDTNENFVVSGLFNSTAYSISVRVISTKGGSIKSAPITVLTGTFEPNDKDLLLDVQKKLVCNWEIVNEIIHQSSKRMGYQKRFLLGHHTATNFSLQTVK